jgi:hypothetical protein
MFALGAPAEPRDVELPLPPNADSISALRWNPGGNMVAASSWDNKVLFRRPLATRSAPQSCSPLYACSVARG